MVVSNRQIMDMCDIIRVDHILLTCTGGGVVHLFYRHFMEDNKGLFVTDSPSSRLPDNKEWYFNFILLI